MNLEDIDLQTIREDYLQLTLRKVAKITGFSHSFCHQAEKAPVPPREYFLKIMTLVLEKRVQVLEEIVSRSELHKELIDTIQKKSS